MLITVSRHQGVSMTECNSALLCMT